MELQRLLCFYGQGGYPAYRQFYLIIMRQQSQKIIMFSKDVSSLPNCSSSKHLLPVIETNQIYPRVFPCNIPLRVALARKIKIYQQFDLNSALAQVQWNYRKGLLDLMYFNFELFCHLEQCTQQKLSEGVVRARALDAVSGQFKEFTVLEVKLMNSQVYLRGAFNEDKAREVQLPKFYACFLFQNPEKYVLTVLQAVKNRQQLLRNARYNFYIDNIDLQGAPEIPKELLFNITRKMNLQFMDRQSYLEVDTCFKRTMNEIMFRHTLLNEPHLVQHAVSRGQMKKAASFKPKNRVIKLMKDNKMFKLVLKSMKSKIEQLSAKNLFFKEQIVNLMQSTKEKITEIYKYQIFDLKDETVAVQRFTSDNMLMVGYFIHFLQEEVINKIAAEMRKELLTHPDGWFKVYNTDKNTYLMSKLRRLFILVEQSTKTVIKEHIRSQVRRYHAVFSKRTAIQVHFHSFKEFKLTYSHSQTNQIQYSPLIIVNVALNNDVLVFGISLKKVQQTLTKNIVKVLSKLLKVDSPQNKALTQIFAMYKNEYGIQIQIPKCVEKQQIPQLGNAQGQQPAEESGNTKLSINNIQFQWVQAELNQLFNLLKRAVSTLSHIEKHLGQISNTLQTKRIAKNAQMSHALNIKDIIQQLSQFKSFRDKVDDALPNSGINFGLFHIEYKIAKDQLIDLLQINIGMYKNMIIKEYQHSSLKLQDQLIRLMKQIEQKPKDIYELVKQRQKLENLESIVRQFNESHQLELYQLCETHLCILGKLDSERRWLNAGKTTAIFQKRVEKQREYNQIRKNITEVIGKQLQDIKDTISLFEVTLSIIKHDWHRSHYVQNFSKLEHLKKQYQLLKQEIQDIRYKQTHLSLPVNDFQIFEAIQQDFLVLHTYWESIQLWEKNKLIWYQSQLLHFELQKPEMMLSDILANIKKIDSALKKNYSNQLYIQILEIKKEIQVFQDNHLKLLKILKKEGFSKKHLQKIGIFIKNQIQDLTLQWAIDHGFLDKIEEIQTVSNEAWNQFYLQQTLDRVFSQLAQMKYEVIFYLDKKGNQIPLINNYQPLNQRLQTIILDLESVQFNPMKSQYQARINELIEKSIYISKSLQSCQIFQKKLVQLHPIFDSTDVVKQLPLENKLFTKLLRNWVQLVNYMKKIVSVYDACNGQNVYQKMTSMINHIQSVKVGLANYLQRKRQGFSRFYLLTDQELYQLFASTNDMKVLSKHINKLFHAVNYITFDQQYITAVEGLHNTLNLQSKVLYRRLNLQDWLTNFERALQLTIRYHIETLISMKKKWTNLLSYPCSQGVLLCYQMEKTFQVSQANNLKKTMESQRNMIKKLVDIKKSQTLSQAEIITLSSLLVLALYFSDKVNFLIANNITDSEHFQMKKMMKIFYKEQQVKIRSFQTEINYGYQYLGLIRRLVLTNLTQRMQLIYMSAIKYSLGGAAIGPAGTGKSQTTKDIARICGKTCLIYNCSQALNIEIIAKILKGMVVSGLWICFDQFNRLSYQVLNILSEQLAIVFKYKAMGMKLEVQYDREVVNFKPDFHLCITYNPTYMGRQKIPKQVMKHFRTVAMVNCDKIMICQLILYSKGFRYAQQLSNKLNKVFDYSEKLWYSFTLYDFGLRSLISVIQLAGLLYKGEGKGQIEVIEAIKILVMPRLSHHHKELMGKAVMQIFQDSISKQTKQGSQGEAQNLRNIMQVRVGIILLGDIFSGKTTTLACFQNMSKEYKIQHIHINTLSVQQIYGQTNATTRKFRDGYLTKKIREFISFSSSHRMLIVLQGVIFSEWIQNLNSVLDNSRSLSLPSGEIMNIPDKIKFLINCSHLEFASPATISRSCVIRFKQKEAQDILKVAPQYHKIKKRALQQYYEVLSLIKQFWLFKIDQKLLFHWINKYFSKSKLQFKLQSFWHLVSLILQGCLNEQGHKILNEYLRMNLALQFNLFHFYWDGKTWKKITDIKSLSVSQDTDRHQHISEIVIKQQKYKKIQYVTKIFLSKSHSDDLLLLLGPANSGKSSIVRQIYQLIDHKIHVFNKINLSRKIKKDRLYSAIQSGLHKKSNKRKGMLQGRELTVFLDDLNLPEVNQYKYKQIVAFLTLLLQKKGCYNYNILQFQAIQDLFLIASCNTNSQQISFSKDFLKSTLPYFVTPYQEEQITIIFHAIVERNTNITKFKPQYLTCCSSLITLMQKLKALSGLLPKYLNYEFVNYRNILNNILEWNISKLPTDDSGVVKQLFIYETSRLIVSRLSQEKAAVQIKEIIDQAFKTKASSITLFHNFDKTVNGTVLDNRNCGQVIVFQEFIRQVQYICDQYVLSTERPNQGLVVFPQLCVRLCYISRGLSLQKGNVSIVGLPKCGKKILLQLCNYLIRGRIYRIYNTYQQKNWYQTIRSASKECFSNKCCSILLLQHFQLKETAQKEELNILLKQSCLPAVFSQADYEQLIYLFQNQLIRSRVAVNKENTVLHFVNYLKSNFKVVMMFNPIMKEFKEDLINYPSISKYTQFYWITQWPTEALLMIASQAILQNQLDLHISIFPKIHETCKNITKQKTNIPHWEGLYLDYLRTFSILYEQNKRDVANKITKLQKSFNVIKQTQLKLQSTRDEIKRLQPTILLLQKQALKTIKSLNIQKANAQSANQQLMKKQTECSKIIAQANIVKKKLETTNALVQQQLKKAWQNVYLVKQTHIAQIKALMNPSELIKIVITAIIIVLNEGDIQIIKNRSQDGFSNQENYFQTGKRFILSKDSKQITRLLTEYKKEKLTKQKIMLLQQKCLNHPRWNIIEAKSANKAIYFFFLWVEAVVKYFKLFQETSPMRSQLQKTTILVDQKNKEIQIVKKQVSIYDNKIKELTRAHQDKTDKLHEYSNKIKLFQKMLTRGFEILKEIQSEKLKWQQYQVFIEEKQKLNFGNTILSSSLIIYNSQHIQQTRQLIMAQIKTILDQMNIIFSNDEIFWFMQNEQEIILKELGIYYNHYVLNNLKIIEKTSKTVFIIDPQQQGFRFLKSMFKVKGIHVIQKVDYRNRSFKKILEKSIVEGTIIFIEITGQLLPLIINQLINPTLKKNQSNGNMEIRIEDKLLPYHSKFKAYLLGTSARDDYSIELISKVTTVNFSITFQQLQEKLTNLLVSVQFPEESEELQELNKTNIKDNIELKTIQKKILNIFAEMTDPQEILKTQQILQVLSTSNRLYQQIQMRIQQSKEKMKHILTRREHYKAKGSKSAQLYFQIKLLKTLSPYYQFSFSWFIDLFRLNIHCFSQALALQITKGLPQQLKVAAPLIIAESQFQKIKFSSLFNAQIQKEKYVLQKFQKLNVSQVRLAKIVGNLKNSNVKNLELFVSDEPQKLSAMLTTPVDEIMQAIPDQFSTLQFFDKLIIINCFRPDCTIKLLHDWLNINLGPTFNTPFAKIIQNTKPQIPIMVKQNSDALISSVDFINNLYDLLTKENKKSVVVINSNNNSLERIKLLIESAFTNDQWLVLQSLGEQHQDLTSFILQLFNQSDFKRKQVFRFWIVVNEVELNLVSEKLIKLSMKIVFEQQGDLIKKIGNSFISQQHSMIKLSDGKQLNKKKYLLNELITFHYMLNEKYKFKTKLWKQPQYFEQADLALNSKYLYFTQPDQMKKLYPNIVSNIIYGGKITDQQDVETISLHIEQTMKNTNLDRNYFWQSVWADDKFPKNQQQYEHYLKNSVIHRNSNPFKTIYEIYGITSFVNNHLAQTQYKKISEFYNAGKSIQQGKDLTSTLKRKVKQLLKAMQMRMRSKISSIVKRQGNIFYYYLIDQKQYCQQKLELIYNQLQSYSDIQDIFSEHEKIWALSIINNKVPLSWNVTTILPLNLWINHLLDAQILIYQMIQDSYKTESQKDEKPKIFQLHFTHNFSTFCQAIFELNNCNSKTHDLLWQPQQIQLVVDNLGVRVQNWYLWNSVFDKRVAPLKEGMIQEYYNCKLPSGLLTVVQKAQLPKLANYQAIPVFSHSFEYGQNSTQILRIRMPIKKVADSEWIKRMRVHLTLHL